VLLRPCRVRRPKLTPSRKLPMSPSLVPGERQTKPHLVGLVRCSPDLVGPLTRLGCSSGPRPGRAQALRACSACSGLALEINVLTSACPSPGVTGTPRIRSTSSRFS
jgi:hypothetical protein